MKLLYPKLSFKMHSADTVVPTVFRDVQEFPSAAPIKYTVSSFTKGEVQLKRKHQNTCESYEGGREGGTGRMNRLDLGTLRQGTVPGPQQARLS